jgi:hypothetical protein
MSQKAQVIASINGGPEVPADFTVDQHWVDVSCFTPRRVPDMAWTALDDAGHFHAFDHDGNLPTLVRREQYIEFGEYDDGEPAGYSTVRVHCSVCDQEMHPAYLLIPAPPEKVPGRTEYWLTLPAAPPSGRFSVTVSVPGRTWFGWGDGTYAQPVDELGGPSRVSVPLGPLWWRNASSAEPPGEPTDAP